MPPTEPIEATFTSSTPPGESAPASGFTRPRVLGAARTLNAAVVGLAGAIETAGLASGFRTEFVDSWRAWAGSWLAYCASLERSLFKLEETAAEVVRQAGWLQQWREALRAELAATGSAGVTIGASAEHQKREGWPLWAVACAGGGIVFGAYKGVQWLMSNWAEERR